MLVKPEDIAELSEAILYLLLNPSTAKDIGEKGREVCRKHFNPNKNGQNLKKIFGRNIGLEINESFNCNARFERTRWGCSLL